VRRRRQRRRRRRSERWPVTRPTMAGWHDGGVARVRTHAHMRP
jgi:hypothetical protein